MAERWAAGRGLSPGLSPASPAGAAGQNRGTAPLGRDLERAGRSEMPCHRVGWRAEDSPRRGARCSPGELVPVAGTIK